MDFRRERRVDNGVGGQHQNFRLAFCRQKRKRLFNTRLSHSPPTPPLTLPLLKDKEPSLAAVGPICRWMTSTLNPKFYLPCRKQLFNTRLSHSSPTPPLALPLLKDKEPSLAAIGSCLLMTTGILLSTPWSDLAPLLFYPPSPLAKSRQR
ncbi:hypothetical protein RHMOL_Rhmol12G0095100 [Rhododendron molle]|uniref:Uncharacterized protein n=1 Tax=Rhododendron molle TaxID=49168 RepID=A0ACC0LH92_RHOML|nr:hypothetical protein RHMOL_Rhmol12G0095100 [Rhododendron molle]